MKPVDYKLDFGARCELCDRPATAVVSHRVVASHYGKPVRAKHARPSVVVTAGHAHVFCHAHCPAHVRPDVGAPLETCPLPAGPGAPDCSTPPSGGPTIAAPPAAESGR